MKTSADTFRIRATLWARIRGWLFIAAFLVAPLLANNLFDALGLEPGVDLANLAFFVIFKFGIALVLAAFALIIPAGLVLEALTEQPRSRLRLAVQGVRPLESFVSRPLQSLFRPPRLPC